MSNRQKSWEERGWVLGEQLQGGNQGHTFFARRFEDDANSFNYVLKRLKRQNDPTLRRRIHVEAQSLVALDFDGIAKLKDSNTDLFADESVDLYVVTERIFGEDLATLGPTLVELNDACRIVQRVLSIVQRCHDVGVVHRDIKPCHVILQNSEVEKPVLIDFGLAFNLEDGHSSSLTALEQGVGNRFIILPEQLHGTSKRDQRSDITQCLGLLFFLITGQNPGMILSAENRKPHDSLDLSSIVKGAHPGQIESLLTILDVGFQHNPDLRWQSAKDLRVELERLVQNARGLFSAGFTARVAQVISKARQNPEVENHPRALALLEEFEKLSEVKSSEAAAASESLVKITRGHKPRKNSSNFQEQWVIAASAYEAPPAQLLLRVTRNADVLNAESTLTTNHPTRGQIANRMKQLSGVRLTDPAARRELENWIEETWVTALEKYLQLHQAETHS